MNNKKYVVGIDLGGTNIKAASVGSDGTIIARSNSKTGVADGYAAVITRIADVVQGLVATSGGSPAAVGIGSAGAINQMTGTIVSSPNFPGWRGAPLVADLSSALGQSVSLDNDGNVAARGEGWVGAAKGWPDFVAITLGTGVGGGICLGGRIWQGSTGAAGEIGHINVVRNGRQCGCGATGCVEQYASATAIKTSARAMYKTDGADWLRQKTGGDPALIGGKLLQEGAEAGDKLCCALFADAGERLGQAMADVALTLDVSRFLIGGGLSAAFSFIAPAARKSAMEAAYILNADRLEINRATLGNDAGMVGAAKMAFDTLAG